MHDSDDNAVFDDLLGSIDLPDDLRALPTERLPQLAEEIRAFLIHSVSQTGGHLAAGLGVVELTIALHYVFNTPHDRLIWDVGHQAYPHKILTGRKQQMSSLRTKDGLSGFPRREESEYDTFGVGHSSTSISAALGMAVAAEKQGIELEDKNQKWEMPLQILCVFIGTIVIYSSLFSIGSFVYGNLLNGFILLTIAVLGTFFLFRSFSKLRAN